MIAMAFVGSCKEKEKEIEPEPPYDYSGVYQVDVEVEARHKIYSTDEAPSNTVDLFGQHIDTSSSICCADPRDKINTCPDRYRMNKLEIFKHNDTFFLRSKLTYDARGNRLTYDRPLALSDDVLTSKTTKEEPEMQFSRDVSTSNVDFYPSHFNLLFLSLKRNDQNQLEGRWFIHDYSSNTYAYLCYNKDENKTYDYGMVEVAKLTLTKIQ